MTDEPFLGHDEFVNGIAPDVLKVLKQIRLFELLDDRFCPTDLAQNASRCAHLFEVTSNILAESGMSGEDIRDVLDVRRSRGACCDCEVLYNVAENSRLKAKYWKNRHAESKEN